MVKVAVHISALFAALVIAYELRRALPLSWWFSHGDAMRVYGWAGLYALTGAIVEMVFQTERGAWRFASVREVVGIVRSASVASAAFLFIVFILDRGMELPRSVPVLAWILSIVFLVSLRLARRLHHEPRLWDNLLPAWWRKRSFGRIPLVIVGPLELADRHLRSIQSDPSSEYEAIGVITPSYEAGLRLHGVPLLGALQKWESIYANTIAANGKSNAILFADPNLSRSLTPEQIGDLRREGHKLLRPQSLADLDGSGRLEEIPLEEFLARQPVSLDVDRIRALIAGRRCLVTGAGGSIGSEIARQLVGLGCGHLTLLDHSEFLLFEIDRELSAAPAAGGRAAVLANVRDEHRLREVFLAEKPEIVFHAAALKHVALVEDNPAEGVLTNVGGTRNVIRAASSSGASQLIMISTDKAVAPYNVMGATKRIAETLLEIIPAAGTRMAAVRFGNVLGSAGSVVPIFKRQISQGGPVTVTDPNVTRYFMTIPEAVQLVLHAAALNAGRQVSEPCKYLLEMGEPVKIIDLAKQMIELSGNVPERDISIQITGLKPGEKLSEDLVDEGEVVAPCIEGVLEVMNRSGGSVSERHLDDLLGLARTGSSDQVATAVHRIVKRIRGYSADVTA